jgi:protein-S-isoprenylcysteine O-methyltransferase Ste14
MLAFSRSCRWPEPAVVGILTSLALTRLRVYSRPVAFCFVAKCIILNFNAAPHGRRIEKTPYYPTAAYLLTETLSVNRNPIHLAEGAIWIGRIVFYRSVVFLGALTVATFVVQAVVHREERGLNARFGET